MDKQTDDTFSMSTITEEEKKLLNQILENSTIIHQGQIDDLLYRTKSVPDAVFEMLNQITSHTVLHEAHMFLIPTHKQHWSLFLKNSSMKQSFVGARGSVRCFIKMMEVDMNHLMDDFEYWFQQVNFGKPDYYYTSNQLENDKCMDMIFASPLMSQEMSLFLNQTPRPLLILQKTHTLKYVTKFLSLAGNHFYIDNISITEICRVFLICFESPFEVDFAPSWSYTEFHDLLVEYFKKKSFLTDPMGTLTAAIEVLHFIATDPKYTSTNFILTIIENCFDVLFKQLPVSEQEKNHMACICKKIKHLVEPCLLSDRIKTMIGPLIDHTISVSTSESYCIRGGKIYTSSACYIWGPIPENKLSVESNDMYKVALQLEHCTVLTCPLYMLRDIPGFVQLEQAMDTTNWKQCVAFISEPVVNKPKHRQLVIFPEECRMKIVYKGKISCTCFYQQE